MKRMHQLIALSALAGLASCNSSFNQAPIPSANVEDVERQAPVSSTPNPTGQIYDQTLNQDGGAGISRSRSGFGHSGTFF